MAHLLLTKQLAADPQTVFDLAADPRQWADVVSGIESVEMLTDGPVRVGTRFRETRIMFGKPHTEEMEVVAYEPGRSWAVAAESCGAWFRTDMRVVPSDGGTRIELETRTEARSFMAKLLSPLASLAMGSMRKAMEKDLEDIRVAAESRRPA